MAKHTYTVASEEGAEFAHRKNGESAEVGAEVELDLSVEEQRAVVAAGWVEPAEEKTTAKKESK